MNNKIHKIHFIGICGVAMSALAIAFKKAGFEVSGSDVGFFPPVSTNLEKHQIDFYPGWHPDFVLRSFLDRQSLGEGGSEGGKNDHLVIVGNVASSTNPEWLYVQKNKLNYLSYPEAIEKYFVKENSIVCAGTYGKTSTSALLSFILSECGYNPSYMFGGIVIDEFDSASLGNVILSEVAPDATKSKNPLLLTRDLSTPPPTGGSAQDDDWSVLEGDEYKSSRWDDGAKFFHYHPTHLLLTAIEWDHADVYPTEKSYFQAFEKLIKSVPKNGIIVAGEKTKNIVKLSNCQIITYGFSPSTTYQCGNVTMDKSGLQFEIIHDSKNYKLQTKTLGSYNVENITGAFAMAHQIGIEPEKIIQAIAKFQGLKRRLEKRFENENITIFDDIAHSPAKAKSVLENLANIYKRHPEERSDEGSRRDSSPQGGAQNDRTKIFCIFEPNTGNRQPQSEPSYNNAFENADEVIIPKLTKLKTSEKLKHWEGSELTKIIAKTHPNVKYIDDDEELVNYLIKQNKVTIVFCGSHGFRGMIEELISKFRTQQGEESLFKI